MKKLGFAVAALGVIALAAPSIASAETVVIKRGEHYRHQARGLEALHARHPEAGLSIAALALHALAEIMERARTLRLTRHQHVLMRLGEMIAQAECAASFAQRAVLAKQNRLDEKFSLSNIIGRSPQMQRVFELIRRSAQAFSTVLILGESGTGKELVARALHKHSPRAEQPFIALNTAANIVDAAGKVVTAPLRAGQRVRVYYTGPADQRVVQRVVVEE